LVHTFRKSIRATFILIRFLPALLLVARLSPLPKHQLIHGLRITQLPTGVVTMIFSQLRRIPLMPRQSLVLGIHKKMIMEYTLFHTLMLNSNSPRRELLRLDMNWLELMLMLGWRARVTQSAAALVVLSISIHLKHLDTIKTTLFQTSARITFLKSKMKVLPNQRLLLVTPGPQLMMRRLMSGMYPLNLLSLSLLALRRMSI
jgi:hypothetical protein